MNYAKMLLETEIEVVPATANEIGKPKSVEQYLDLIFPAFMTKSVLSTGIQHENLFACYVTLIVISSLLKRADLVLKRLAAIN